MRYGAFGRQPVFKDPAKVEALELRDPAPVRPAGPVGAGARLGGNGWIFIPVLVLGLAALSATARRPRRRTVAVALAAGGAGVVVLATVSLAQQSVPTTTPLESLPSPARIFSSSNPLVLAPVASRDDDPRRDPRSQTEDGAFAARCAGTSRISITSGFETTARTVRVPSRRGRIVRRARALRPRVVPGRRRTVARIRLGQPAEVLVRVRRHGRTRRVLRHDCIAPGARRLRVAWDGRLRRRGKLRAARPGLYRVQIAVRSDRRTLVRGSKVRVLRRK